MQDCQIRAWWVCFSLGSSWRRQQELIYLRRQKRQNNSLGEELSKIVHMHDIKITRIFEHDRIVISVRQEWNLGGNKVEHSVPCNTSIKLNLDIKARHHIRPLPGQLVGAERPTNKRQQFLLHRRRGPATDEMEIRQGVQTWKIDHVQVQDQIVEPQSQTANTGCGLYEWSRLNHEWGFVSVW